MELHDRIREVRKYFKMTQSEFGKKIGVSRDVIGNIEYDRLAKPEQKEPLLMLICREFGVNENWLRFGLGEMFDPLTEGEELAALFGDLMREDNNDNPIKKMLLAFLKLTPDEQEMMKKLMSKMLSEKK